MELVDLIGWYMSSSIVLSLLYLKCSNGDLGEYPINIFKAYRNHISNESITWFGITVVTICWLVWNFIVLPWTIIGVIFFRFPKFIISKMYKSMYKGK